MTGTASPVDRWLLVEIAGPWGRQAFTQSHLDPRIGRAILDSATRRHIRPTAIRRPGRHPDQREWRWAYADSRPGHETLTWGVASRPEALLEIDLDDLSARSSQRTVDEPVYLVCTHSRHDQCCAVRGRPVVETLARLRPERTWECSHVGGDRFAATMVILPMGFYFGRIDTDNTERIVSDFERGILADTWLRGRSSLPPPVQAAQRAARLAYKDARTSAYLPIECIPTGTHRWRVRLRGTDGPVTVEVVERQSSPIHATCAATWLASVPEYDARLIDETRAISGQPA